MKKFPISPVLPIQLLIVLAMFGAGYLLYDKLPAQMPSHWNIEGEVDSYISKQLGVVLFPSITLAIALLFPILSKIDPRKEKYALFKRPWLILQMVFVMFFAYIYFVSLYLTFHPEQSAAGFILGGIGVLFVLIGNYLGKIRQNYFIGIKTPWTLHSEDVWNKTHRLGGWCFAIAGLVIFGNAFVQWHMAAVMSVATVFAVVPPIVYSYLLHRR